MKYIRPLNDNASVNKVRILTGYLEAENVTFLPASVFFGFSRVRFLSVSQTLISPI